MPHLLKTFQRVNISKGKSAVIVLKISASAFRYWNEAVGKYIVPEGQAEIQIGSSSADIRGTANLTIMRAKS